MFFEGAYLLCLPIIFATDESRASIKGNFEEYNQSSVEIFDLTHPTTWEDLSEFYGAIEKGWKVCVNCGVPGLGTVIHLEHINTAVTMKPAIIPTEYLISRLKIIDVSYLARVDPGMILTMDLALQWPVLKQDPKDTTLLLFKFGWRRTSTVRQCTCRTPGLSYELAEWISSNLLHVVGVATDAPSLESEQTRELSVKTVSNLLGWNGIYIIENVNLGKTLPDDGCLAIAMPIKLKEATYVPVRLTALCSTQMTDEHTASSLLNNYAIKQNRSRLYDVNLYEILN